MNDDFRLTKNPVNLRINKRFIFIQSRIRPIYHP